LFYWTIENNNDDCYEKIVTRFIPLYTLFLC